MRLRALAIAVSGLLPSALVILPSVANAQAMVSPVQAIDNCRLIHDTAKRLSCYDLIDTSGAARSRQSAASPAPGMNVAAAPASAAPTPSLAPQSPAGVASVATPQSVAPVDSSVPPARGDVAAQVSAEDGKKTFGLPDPPKVHKVTEISSEVASTRLVGPNYLRVVTTDGQIWDQTEGTTARARVGEKIVIRENFMGGLVCKVGNRQTYRCSRSDHPERS